MGTEIKAGQLLLSIGDLSGFSTQVKVNEVNIVNMKPGMGATITGDAFPGIILHGKVSSVASQANPDSSGGGGGGGVSSMYNVDVRVPNVPSKLSKTIRVGMTSKVEIDIEFPSQISLPIKAVFQKNGQSMVTVIDSQGKNNDVPVETGLTTPTDVVVTKGIKPGDKVVIHD